MKKPKRLTIEQFRERFPDDDACLGFLFKKNYGNLLNCPKCGREPNFKRVKNRRAYQCSTCAFHIYPTAGTVWHQSTIPLSYHFYACYLFTTTRNGVAAKELERQLNICYKTALRMAHQIKRLMGNRETKKLLGEIVMDEKFLGGSFYNMHQSKRNERMSYNSSENKTAVFGMMDKEGKSIITKIMAPEKIKGKFLKPIIRENVDSNSTVVTDGFGGYSNLHKEFSSHEIINHLKGEYARNGFSTNRIENYWSTLSRMIRGTHIHVSSRHLSKYVDENSFRYVNRGQPEKMLDLILENV